jgi:hypothetical protein
VRAYPEGSEWLSRQQSGMRNAKAEANERIRATQMELGIDNGNLLPFLCECNDATCRAIIRLTATAYGEARAGGRFVVDEGHPAGGRVVEAGQGYVVVEE